MYKLENNVEWTDDLKNAFKHGITRAKIIYIDDNEEEKEINENNYLISVQIDDLKYVPDNGIIGQATSKMATISLINQEELMNLENKEIEIYIGAIYEGETYYINYGKFIVTPPPENDATNDKSQVVAFDYMIKANELWKNEVTYPCTLRQYATAVCNQIGIDLQEERFTNDTFLVEDNQFEGDTCRDVIQNIAKCAFSWARIGQDNKLHFDFAVNNNPVELITKEEYKVNSFKKANEYYGAINKVTYAQRDVQGQEEFVEDRESILNYGEKELIIYDNLFAYNSAKRYELIQAGTCLFGLKYMPIMELDLVGLAYLDCNDIIQVEDMEGNRFLTRNFNHTIIYEGYLSDSISSEAESQTQLKYENKNSMGNAIAKTEIIVDKANKQIQSIITEIGDRSEKTSTITQDIDRIESEISDTVVYKNEVEGTTQIYLPDAGKVDMLYFELKGNQTYRADLFPYSGLYPSSDLYPNMGGSEIK